MQCQIKTYIAMGIIKEKLLNEYLSSPYKAGEKVLVRGKYLSWNESQDDDAWNEVTVLDVTEENSKTVLKVQREGYDTTHYKGHIDKVVVDLDVVRKSTLYIGVNPIPTDYWNKNVRMTGLGVSNVIHRILDDIEKDVNHTYYINGIYIPELNFNPFVYNKNGERLYYQRDYVWTLDDEQNFIESMYNRLNLGTVVFRKRSWKWLENETSERDKDGDNSDLGFFDIVDGKQRIHTIMRFLTDQFPDKNGNYYSDFSELAKRKFEDCGALSVMEIQEDATEEDVLRVFLNVNYTGRPLSQEHLDYVRDLYKNKM